MKKLSTFWELEKCNEAVDYYPTISAQETKINKQSSLTKLNLFIWEKELFNQK